MPSFGCSRSQRSWAREIWSAFDLPSGFLSDGTSRTWTKLNILAQTGSPFVTATALVGLGLVLLVGPGRARVASGLGAVLGAWSTVAGFLGIAVTFHHEQGTVPFSVSDNRLVGALSFAAYAVMGVVVFWLAIALAAAGGAAAQNADEPPEPEVAELS